MPVPSQYFSGKFSLVTSGCGHPASLGSREYYGGMVEAYRLAFDRARSLITIRSGLTRRSDCLCSVWMVIICLSLLITRKVPNLFRSGNTERLKGVGSLLSPIKALIRSPSLLAVDCSALLSLK